MQCGFHYGALSPNADRRFGAAQLRKIIYVMRQIKANAHVTTQIRVNL